MGDKSLFQNAAQMLTGDRFAPPTIVTASEYRFIVTKQLSEVGLHARAILLEPHMRDTAPAVLAAALSIGEDRLVLVAPSDHVIPDHAGFRDALRIAIPAAQQGLLVTFGITPDRPETGYGWLELDSPAIQQYRPGPHPLKRFVEKPDREKAEHMLAGGKHLWNAGIFLFRADAMVKAFQTHQPQLLEIVQSALDQAQADLGFTRLDPNSWEAAETISLDYAIMEKAENLSVVSYEGAWTDLGEWNAVWRESEPNSDGVVATGPSLAIDCRDTLLRSEHDALQVVGIGLDNIIAVAMPDAVLVAHKDHAQNVKNAVLTLKARDAPQAETLPRDYRPWGWFESLATGTRFQVKRIHVHPGAALSLQSHQHRSEHWIVVQGTAKVSIDGHTQLVTENQSVFIPLGAVHRLENSGKLPLILIEVQTGSYLGEDDITRYDDLYARTQTAPG